MAKLNDKQKVEIKKNPTRQKIIIEQGRAMGTPIVEHKVLHTEIVASAEDAKVRIKELKEEYKETEALSISYFSL